jgi:hypothetical protein
MQFKWIESAGEGIGKFLLVESAGERTLYAGIFPWHKNLFGAIKEMREEELIAAGDFNKNFEVTKWFSEGFGVVTPRELRDIISAELRNHKDVVG